MLRLLRLNFGHRHIQSLVVEHRACAVRLRNNWRQRPTLWRNLRELSLSFASHSVEIPPLLLNRVRRLLRFSLHLPLRNTLLPLIARPEILLNML